MKKGIVILAEDYCPHWEKLFLEEKPHSVGIHFRPFDYPMKEYLARINAAPFRRSLEKLEQERAIRETFTVKNSGKYYIKIVNGDVESDQKEITI